MPVLYSVRVQLPPALSLTQNVYYNYAVISFLI